MLHSNAIPVFRDGIRVGIEEKTVPRKDRNPSSEDVWDGRMNVECKSKSDRIAPVGRIPHNVSYGCQGTYLSERLEESFMRSLYAFVILLFLAALAHAHPAGAQAFEGRYFSGEGDAEYLQLLDTAARLFHPDPEYQNISMLYTPVWNGFVEGPTWGAWWIQNSYGPTYCSLPFFVEPYTTFVQNAQDLWFSHIGDGKTVGEKGWVGPDGCLCDAAAPTLVYYKQGDGRIDIHDWGMEFTAAGVVMQSELLLISRDPDAIRHYLPLLERSANFIETRRDPSNNLFLAGAAGNLLAPSYAGWHKPDGTYDKAYLTGLSVTYIAALDRLIELEKLAGNTDKAALYTERRELAKQGLPLLTTEEGYFIKSMDPDGTKHGVYGSEKHGYFDAVCNHDAIAFRVADDAQARRIYEKIASLPGLRPHGVIITNYPGLDDTYANTEEWLWSFGTWVNGGHWTTCEARMVLGYYRLGQYDDARRSMEHILGFARQFRMDNPLVEFGAQPYQPKEPINCVYDNWGTPAAMIRGLFEYLYRADALTLLPHIPAGITRLEQRFPIRFGTKRLFLSTHGNGPVTAVRVNNEPWEWFDGESITLPYDRVPQLAVIQIALGGAALPEQAMNVEEQQEPFPEAGDSFWDISSFIAATTETSSGCSGEEGGKQTHLPVLQVPFAQLGMFYNRLAEAGLASCYEARHARLACAYMNAIHTRAKMKSEDKINMLPEVSQYAADRSYVETAVKLADGLVQTVTAYEGSGDPHKEKVFAIWKNVGKS